ADVVAAAPVPCEVAEGREAHMLSVGRHADAIHAGAAGHCDAPAALRAGTQDGERVVSDTRLDRPTARLERGARDVLLLREVQAGEHDLRELDAAVETGLVDEILQRVDAAR